MQSIRSAKPVCLGSFLAGMLFLGGAGVARANGAFPDSQVILAPAGQPNDLNDLILGTNFGLVISVDAGVTWDWMCESPMTAYARYFSVASAPGERLFAVAIAGLAHTDDRGCSWSLAGGTIAGLSVIDAFVDPTQPARVLAAALDVPPNQPSAFGVFESLDGGATFGPPLVIVSPEVDVTGLESAASDPRTIVVTTFDWKNAHPWLVRTENGGKTWTTHDLQPLVGSVETRILGVDPTNPHVVLLRLLGADDQGRERDAIAVATEKDGSLGAQVPVTLPDGRLTAFVRRANGKILVAGVRAGGSKAAAIGYRSHDGGQTFEDWDPKLHLRSLAERDGRLFAAADNIFDMVAVATTVDENGPWQPLMKYDQIRAIRTCGRTSCRSDCESKALLALWDPRVCAATPIELDASVGQATDAGTGDAAVEADAGAGAGSGAEPPEPKSGSGCGCRVGRAPGVPPVAVALTLLFVAAIITTWGRCRPRAHPPRS